MKVGEEITKLMREQGLSRRKLSIQTNLNVLTVRAIQEGKSNDLRKIKLILEKLGCRIEFKIIKNKVKKIKLKEDCFPIYSKC